MASTQLRLITAIRDAMAAKGVKVNEEKQGEPDVEPEQEEAPGSEADDDLTYDNIILADYALEKLCLDIRKGTVMQPKRLYELIRAIVRSGEMTIV